MDKCSVCKDLVAQVIRKLSIGLGCTEVAAEFETLCVAAGGGPEDPVADAVCTPVAAVIDVVCNQLGWHWMKEHVEEASEIVCRKADLCS